MQLVGEFFWDLEDGGDCRVEGEDKERHFLNSEKRQVELSRGPSP